MGPIHEKAFHRDENPEKIQNNVLLNPANRGSSISNDPT